MTKVILVQGLFSWLGLSWWMVLGVQLPHGLWYHCRFDSYKRVVLSVPWVVCSSGSLWTLVAPASSLQPTLQELCGWSIYVICIQLYVMHTTSRSTIPALPYWGLSSSVAYVIHNHFYIMGTCRNSYAVSLPTLGSSGMSYICIGTYISSSIWGDMAYHSSF